MPIADKMIKMVESASMIKKMFEEGSQMKEKYGRISKCFFGFCQDEDKNFLQT